MEQEKMNLHNNRYNSTQHVAGIDDILLEMLQHEALLNMKVNELQKAIEDALESANKENFIKATSELKIYEHILAK